MLIGATVLAGIGSVRADHAHTGAAPDGISAVHAAAVDTANDFRPRHLSRKFQYLEGMRAPLSGPLHWSYNHSGAPDEFDRAATIQTLIDALSKWTSACGIEAHYDGETTAVPGSVVGTVPDSINVVGWLPDDPFDTAAYVIPSIDEHLGGGPALVDADMVLNSTEQPFAAIRPSDLARIAVHEWGHMLGLGHSNVNGVVMSGPPYTSYTTRVDLRPDDVAGCRCMYGLPPGVSAAYLCPEVSNLDFGNVAIGAQSPQQQITLTARGNMPITIGASLVYSLQYQLTNNTCTSGRPLSPGESCSLNVASVPTYAGGLFDQLRIDTSGEPVLIQLVAQGVAAVVSVVEYYHAGLDHYFMTPLATEIAGLDSGSPPGWARTGQSFNAYATAVNGSTPVCRYYIPPARGDSHFFSASPSECDESGAKFPDFVLESKELMDVVPVNMVSGTCPAGLPPVYRVWNGRLDSNHRYLTDRTVRDHMVATGYIAEGYGPDGVVMCALP